MRLIRNLCQQCFLLNKVFVAGRSGQLYRMTSSVMFPRLFHFGFFIKEGGVHRKCILPNSFNVTTVIKRNGSKKSKGGKGGKSAGKIDLSAGEGVIDLRSIKENMGNVTRNLSDEYREKYSAKLASSTLDNIRVKIDGTRSALYEIAEVKSGDNEFIITSMTGEKSDDKKIIEALQKSLNVSAKYDDPIIRIPMSASGGGDYKANLVKLVKDSTEKSKVEIRTIRQRGMVQIKKQEKSVGKDMVRSIEKQVQLLTDAHNQEIKDMLSKKLSELGVSK